MDLIKRIKLELIVAIIVSIIVAMLMYPYSYIVDILWLVGSHISPGITNSFTGWFVFFSVTVLSIIHGIIAGILYHIANVVFKTTK